MDELNEKFKLKMTSFFNDEEMMTTSQCFPTHDLEELDASVSLSKCKTEIMGIKVKEV